MKIFLNIPLVSSEETIQKGQATWLAIFETLFGVFIYWFVAIRYSFYLHIIVSIAVTPILLLKSKKSVKYALLLMHGYTLPIGYVANTIGMKFYEQHYESYGEKHPKLYMLLLAIHYILHPYTMFIFIIYSGYFLLLGFVAYHSWLAMPDGFWFFKIVAWLIATLIGAYCLSFLLFSVSLDVTVKVWEKSIKESIKNGNVSKEKYLQLAGGIFLAILKFPIYIGFLLRTNLIRIYATLKYIHYGVFNIKENWKSIVFCTDFCKRIEILPEMSKSPYLSRVSLSWWNNNVSKENEYSLYIKTEYTIVFFIFYLPAIIYRISLKSTFWFYFPLIFILSSVKKIPSTSEKNIKVIQEFLVDAYKTPYAQLSFVIAIALLAWSIFSNYLYNGDWLSALNNNENYEKFLWFFLLTFDYSNFLLNLYLWQLIEICLAFFCILLFFVSGHLYNHLLINPNIDKHSLSYKLSVILAYCKKIFVPIYLTISLIFLIYQYIIINNIPYIDLDLLSWVSIKVSDLF